MIDFLRRTCTNQNPSASNKTSCEWPCSMFGWNMLPIFSSLKPALVLHKRRKDLDKWRSHWFWRAELVLAVEAVPRFGEKIRRVSKYIRSFSDVPQMPDWWHRNNLVACHWFSTAHVMQIWSSVPLILEPLEVPLKLLNTCLFKHFLSSSDPDHNSPDTGTSKIFAVVSCTFVSKCNLTFLVQDKYCFPETAFCVVEATVATTVLH